MLTTPAYVFHAYATLAVQIHMCPILEQMTLGNRSVHVTVGFYDTCRAHTERMNSYQQAASNLACTLRFQS